MMPASPRPSVPPKRRAKLLMLHGNGQSATFFQAKTRFLEQGLKKAFSDSPLHCFQPSFPGGLEFIYVDAPLSALEFLQGTPTGNEYDDNENQGIYEDLKPEWRAWGYGDPEGRSFGVDRSLHHLLKVLNEQGPFIGVVGFSAGAALATMVAALLEGKRKVEGLDLEVSHPPFRFIICFSGFIQMDTKYKSLYSPSIRTPSLHFIGTLDPIIPMPLTLKLAERFNNAWVEFFEGAHYVPRGKEVVNPVIQFVTHALGWKVELRTTNIDWEDIG